MDRKSIIVTISAAAVTAAVTAAAAAPPSGAVPGMHSSVFPVQRAQVTTIDNMFVAQNNPVANIVAGENTFETANVKCLANKCTLAISAMDQIGLCDALGGWAIAVYVDGTLINSQYQGAEPTSSIEPGFQIGNWQGFAANLRKGYHQVVFNTYVEGNCIQDQWAVRIDSATTHA